MNVQISNGAGQRTANRPRSTVHRLRSARRVGAGLALALALTACGGDDGPSPGDVTIKWRFAEDKGDFQTSWALEAPERAGPPEKKAATIAGREERRKNRPPRPPGDELADVEVTRTVEDDTQREDFVFVYLRVTEKDGDSRDEIVTLRRVKGKWRVAKWEP